MFLNGRSWYNVNGQRSAGSFLAIVTPGWGPARAMRAVVRYVQMRQSGHFMVGEMKLMGHRIPLSGTYGRDGLCCDIPEEVYEAALPVPDFVYEAWRVEKDDVIRAWALENLDSLRAACRKGPPTQCFIEILTESGWTLNLKADARNVFDRACEGFNLTGASVGRATQVTISTRSDTCTWRSPWAK